MLSKSCCLNRSLCYHVAVLLSPTGADVSTLTCNNRTPAHAIIVLVCWEGYQVLEESFFMCDVQ